MAATHARHALTTLAEALRNGAFLVFGATGIPSMTLADLGVYLRDSGHDTLYLVSASSKQIEFSHVIAFFQQARNDSGLLRELAGRHGRALCELDPGFGLRYRIELDDGTVKTVVLPYLPYQDRAALGVLTAQERPTSWGTELLPSPPWPCSSTTPLTCASLASRTDDPRLPTATSLVGYVFQRLAIAYLPDHDLAEILAAHLRIHAAEAGLPALAAASALPHAVAPHVAGGSEPDRRQPPPRAVRTSPQAAPAASAHCQAGGKQQIRRGPGR